MDYNTTVLLCDFSLGATYVFWKFLFCLFSRTAIKLDKYISPLITLLCFFPPALISVIFLIETVFYKQYTYFAFSIYLMIFPLLFRTCLYLLRFLCVRIEESVFSHIIKPLVTGHEDKTYYIWHEEASIYVLKNTKPTKNFMNKSKNVINTAVTFVFLIFGNYY